jgi:hypothetical protein
MRSRDRSTKERAAHTVAVALALAVALAVATTADVRPGSRAAARVGRPRAPSACEGARGPLPTVLEVHARAGAFPGSEAPDVAVHVPPGFDATRRPGLVLYLHGWRGCAGGALAEGDAPCVPGGVARAASNLAAQIDGAGVNAILAALELRADLPTGEPGALAVPGDLRALLHEILGGRLAPILGCAIEIEALDRVVVIAHSGGYQAAAAALRWGDVPEVREVVLLDALYGGGDVFATWIAEGAARLERGDGARRRFVDLYTCCGGTADASRALAARARAAMGDRAAVTMADDDTDRDVDARDLAHDVVFKRVLRAHGDLPRAYVGAVVQAAGFARRGSPGMTTPQ